MSIIKHTYFTKGHFIIWYFMLIFPLFISANESSKQLQGEITANTSQVDHTKSGEENHKKDGAKNVANNLGAPAHIIGSDPKDEERRAIRNHPNNSNKKSFIPVWVSDSLMLFFTFVLAAATIGLYIVTGRTATAAKETANISINAERARLYIDSISITKNTNPDNLPRNTNLIQMEIIYNINNSGRSPAHNVNIDLRRVIARTIDCVEDNSNEFIGPHHLDKLEPKRHPIAIPNIIPTGNRAYSKVMRKKSSDWREGKFLHNSIFIYGSISYSDIFGRSHESSFGYRCEFPESGTRGEIKLVQLSHADYWKST